MPDSQAAGPGHNSDKGIAAQRLKSFIERAERVLVDIENARNDLKEVWSEAKSTGYDVKTMKQVVKIRKMDKAERQEQEALLEVYLDAVGE